MIYLKAFKKRNYCFAACFVLVIGCYETFLGLRYSLSMVEKASTLSDPVTERLAVGRLLLNFCSDEFLKSLSEPNLTM